MFVNWLHHVNRKTLCLGVLFFCFATVDSVLGKAMNPTKEELRMANLEATVVIRSLQHMAWQKDHLPPKASRVKVVVVGHDYCLFKERLQYLIGESETSVHGRNIVVKGCKNLEEANQVSQNKQVVFVVLLESVAGKWNVKAFVKRAGLIVYGQGKAFMRRGLSLCSRVENNRLKMSINRKKMQAVEVEFDHQLYLRNPTLYSYN